MLITSILSSVLARYGISTAQRNNWLPKNHYQRKALDCLKMDDIEGAITNNRVVRQKDPGYEEAQIIQEMILMWLDNRIRVIQEKTESGSKRIDEYRESIAVIRRKAKLYASAAGLITAAVVILPLLFTFILPRSIIPYITAVYAAGSGTALYFYLKNIGLDTEKSPFIALYEQMESVEYKISIAARTNDNLIKECSSYREIRDNVKKEIDGPVPLIRHLKPDKTDQ